MGMFDDVSVFMECPSCHNFIGFDAQTKDLECEMFHYRPLPDDWFTGKNKKFRDSLPVFPKFPLDKEASIWISQAERAEAQATIGDFSLENRLKYINVVASCPKCGKHFDGKIRVEDGKLMGDIYDMVEWQAPKEVKMTNSELMPIDEERKPVCPHLDTTIIDDKRYCVDCGKEILEEDDKDDSIAPPGLQEGGGK